MILNLVPFLSRSLSLSPILARLASFSKSRSSWARAWRSALSPARRCRAALRGGHERRRGGYVSPVLGLRVLHEYSYSHSMSQ